MTNIESALLCFAFAIYAIISGIGEITVGDAFNQFIGVYAICVAIVCFLGGCWFLFFT